MEFRIRGVIGECKGLEILIFNSLSKNTPGNDYSNRIAIAISIAPSSLHVIRFRTRATEIDRAFRPMHNVKKKCALAQIIDSN